MKIFALILVIIGSVSFGYSQIEDLDLNQFKYPDLKRQTLVLSLNMFNRNQNFNNDFSFADTTITTKRNQFNFFGEANYTFTRNTRKVQQDISGNGNIVTNFSKQDDSKTKSFHPQIDLDMTHRQYYKPQYFWQLTSRQNLDYMGQETNTSKANSKHIYSNLGVGWGIGRLENIQDLHHAYFLVKGLNSSGHTTLDFNQVEMEELAAHVAMLKNQRFLDFRHKRIWELEQIDSFLNIDASDARYFATLADFWDYGYISNRFSGKRLLIHFTPEYNYQQTTEQGKLNYFAFNLGLEYRDEKPLSIHMQRSFSAILDIIKFQEKPDLSMETSYQGSLTYGYSIYPSTRSYIDVYAMGSLVFNKNNRELDEFSFSPGIGGEIGYYFSPELRLFGEFSINYGQWLNGIKELDQYYSHFNNYVNIRITYNYF